MYTLFQNYCENFLLEMIWKKKTIFYNKMYIVDYLDFAGRRTYAV